MSSSNDPEESEIESSRDELTDFVDSDDDESEPESDSEGSEDEWVCWRKLKSLVKMAIPTMKSTSSKRKPHEVKTEIQTKTPTPTETQIKVKFSSSSSSSQPR